MRVSLTLWILLFVGHLSLSLSLALARTLSQRCKFNIESMPVNVISRRKEGTFCKKVEPSTGAADGTLADSSLLLVHHACRSRT